MINKQINILLFDIESFANLGYIWGKYEQNVIAYEKEWYMLMAGYKWLHEKSVHVIALPDYKIWKKNRTDDRELIKAIWELFDKADIIIGHNAQSFDIKKTNAKFIEHGFPPPSPYKIIDTKLVAKRYFNFNSNKLDDLGNILGLGRKIETGGFDLWLGCAAGDMKSWSKMTAYNKQDVLLLEKVYLKMLPYMTNHPNWGIVIGERSVCPNCGSEDLQSRGVRYGKRSWFCKDCHSWHTSTLKEDSQVR